MFQHTARFPVTPLTHSGLAFNSGPDSYKACSVLSQYINHVLIKKSFHIRCLFTSNGIKNTWLGTFCRAATPKHYASHLYLLNNSYRYASVPVLQSQLQACWCKSLCMCSVHHLPTSSLKGEPPLNWTKSVDLCQ